MERGLDIRNSTVMVTGATSGIGREVAKTLAGKGAHVVLAVRDLHGGAMAAEAIRKAFPEAVVEVGPELRLDDAASIRAFADTYRKQQRPLHVLVNNAGANYISDGVTADGVPLLTQVNYVGPYMLTRLLEPCLRAAGHARVVNVSSVTHRYGVIGNPAAFLSSSNSTVGGQYPATKLANVLFTYELQRRYGTQGIQACAVDPGSVATAIYRDSKLFSAQPLKWIIEKLYAPPWDGAAAVVHVASAPSWGAPAPPRGRSRMLAEWPPHMDLQQTPQWFFARGLFALPIITHFRGPGEGLLNQLRMYGWAAKALTLSALDWPLRRVTNGAWGSGTTAVPSAPTSYDRGLSTALWDLTADKCGLSRE
ncbi:g7180 [Coccomyxa viridis]|uniref:G7180 protein n=1 Tax=Coccomyxa viridis TaxID=1274662 RepID=A0ABP1FYC6_9CHLO